MPLDSPGSLPPQLSGRGRNEGGALYENDVVATAAEDSRGSLGTETVPIRHGLDRGRPRFLLFWTLVPACCLILALTGILLSGPWLNPGAPELRAPQGATSAEAPLSSSVSSHPEVSRRREIPFRDSGAGTGRETGDPIAQAFWTPTSGPMAPCEALLRSQTEWLEKKDHAPCQIYPLWVEYLVLETAATPVCELEPTFSIASDALQSKTLCGPGHAFLAAYYLKKRLLKRAQSFLDEALRLAPDDPWVKLVEAAVYERAYYDDKKAIPILEDLSRGHPSFSPARYLLGKAYIRVEEYREAIAAFESLKEEAKGQVAFWRIRRALSSLEQVAGHSVEQAEALLALSRAFSTLKDYPMAQDLYRGVLEDMPDKLPKRERIAAYCELGRIYERRGDRSSAYDSYRRALEIDPESPAAREGLQGILPNQTGHS